MGKGAGAEVCHIRRYPHAKAATDYLRTLGATDISVTRKAHLRVHWTFAGKSMSITLSSTPTVPRQIENKARQLVRFEMKKYGFSEALKNG